MTTMDDTVCDIWAPSDQGLADLFDNGHDSLPTSFDLDFGDSSPRVKLPSTAPLDLNTELNSSEMENTWALGSPLKGRAPLTRTASLEFAFGKVRGLKRDASLDKIFVSPMNMETWGEDTGASAATNVSAAPAPAAPTASTAPDTPIVAPPVPVVTAPPAVAPAAPVTASAAPTMPETAPAPPKYKNKRKGAQKKGRTAQAEDDAEDDAAATAQSNTKTTQSNTKTTQSNTKTAQAAGTTQRQRSTAASTKAPAASSRVPSASARASTSTARATAADDAAPYAPRATSRAARRAAKARRAMQSLMDADVEDASGVDSAEATSANAFGNANAIAKDAANLTPSPTRTPPPSASTTAPALAPAGALDRVAASPQKVSRKDKGHATKAQADVDEHTTANNDNEGSALRAYVGVDEILQSAPATQSSVSAPANHVEPAQQLPAALMQNTLAQPLAHYTPPAPAHGHLIAQVPQSGDAASRIRAHAPGDVRLTPARVQDMHDIEAAFWPPTAPTHHQLFVPAPWYHNVVLAAQPHAMFNGQPMLPGMMLPPPPTMSAPPMQYQTNAPAPANGSQAQQVSSTQYGPWVPPSHLTSIEPPAPALHYNAGAPLTQASDQAHPPMRAASGASSSRAGTYVDGNGMARAISPLPQRALASTSSSAAESQPRTNAYASGRSHLGSQAISSAARSAPTIDLPESVMKVLRNNSKYAAPIAQLQRLSAPVNPLAGAASSEPYRVVTGMKRKGQFSASQSVDCQYDHGAGRPEYCGHSFVLDCSEAELMKRVLDHLGFSRLERKRCCWNGCLLTQTYQCNQLGLGHHILDKHFPKGHDGAPAPKHARHH